MKENKERTSEFIDDRCQKAIWRLRHPISLALKEIYKSYMRLKCLKLWGLKLSGLSVITFLVLHWKGKTHKGDDYDTMGVYIDFI